MESISKLPSQNILILLLCMVNHTTYYLSNLLGARSIGLIRRGGGGGLGGLLRFRMRHSIGLIQIRMSHPSSSGSSEKFTDESDHGVVKFYNSLVRMSLTPTWPTGERARPLAQGVVYINHKSKGFDDSLIRCHEIDHPPFANCAK